eukprot:TRINITY_DN6199_c0_g1_i2.p1 TRINITY_DN6199_c0_g1~~TRINITY_DN6199_c0_g1_i2.p1  ORF type:complete len:1079 (+),score=236.47 TRINITY_DN6199_c0_g1_i2:90-3239(+)
MELPNDVPTNRSPSNFAEVSAEILTPEGAEQDAYPLHYAAAVGDTKAVSKILAGKQRKSAKQAKGGSRKVPKIEPNAQDSFGHTALVYAVISNKMSCVDVLLKKGASPNVTDKEGRTSIHWACFYNRPQLLQRLIDAKADVCVKDAENRGPLHICSSSSDTQCFQLILQAQGSQHQLDDVDHWGMTVLHWAAFNGSLALTQLLRETLHVSMLVGDREGKLATHWAAHAGHTKVLHCLLESWLDDDARHEDERGVQYDLLNAPDGAGQTVLHLAAAGDNYHTVSFLLSLNELNCNKADAEGRTALHWAAHASSIKSLEAILAVVNESAAGVADASGLTPLHYATNAEDIAVVKRLLQIKGVYDTPDTSGRTALMLALSTNNYELIMAIISSKKSNVNQVDSEGNTPLHAAAFFGAASVVQALLQAGADCNAVDKSGQPAIFFACEAGHYETVDILVKADASLSYVDEEQRTLLHWASVGGHLRVCQILLESNRINVDAQDTHGRTALHSATFADRLDVLTELLKHNASVNLQDGQGISALHWAASRQNTDIIQALLEHGAFINYTEFHPDRLTPLDYAAMTGNHHVIALLRSAGALTVEEVRHFAAEHIQSWWQAYKTRAKLLEVWRKHHGADARRTLSPKMRAKIDKVPSARPMPKRKVEPSSEPTSPKKEPKKIKQKPVKKKSKSKLATPKTSNEDKASELPVIQPSASVPKAGLDAVSTQVVELPSLMAPTLSAPPPEARPRAPPTQQQTVRYERSRIQDIRAKIRAAQVIQRAYRRYKIQQQIAAFDDNPVRTKRIAKPVGLDDSNPLFNGTGLTRPVVAPVRAKEGKLGFTVDVTNKQQQVAALVIQLAWRKHFGAKMKNKAKDALSAQQELLLLRQAHRAALQRQAYLARPAPAVQWRPTLQSTRRPAFLKTIASPAVTSFNMAQHTYKEPLMDLQQQRLKRAEELLRQRTEHTRTLRDPSQLKQASLTRTSTQPLLSTDLPPANTLRKIDPHEILRQHEERRHREGLEPLSPRRVVHKRGNEFVLDKSVRAALLAKARETTLV